MIILITGSNKLAIQNFIKGRKKKYDKNVIHELENGSISPLGIMDVAYATGMFSGLKKLIIIHAVKVEDVNFPENFLKWISANADIEFVIDASTLVKTSIVYKLLKKYAKIQLFENPNNYSGFNISDALFIQKDKGRALQLVSQINDIDTNFYTIISAIYFGIRNTVSKNENNSTWQILHPFVKKKTAQININATRAKSIYRDLFELDVSLKLSTGSRLNRIYDFVLECDC